MTLCKTERLSATYFGCTNNRQSSPLQCSVFHPHNILARIVLYCTVLSFPFPCATSMNREDFSLFKSYGIDSTRLVGALHDKTKIKMKKKDLSCMIITDYGIMQRNYGRKIIDLNNHLRSPRMIDNYSQSSFMWDFSL